MHYSQLFRKWSCVDFLSGNDSLTNLQDRKAGSLGCRFQLQIIMPHSQHKQVESKIQITSVKFVSAATLSYWQPSSLLLTVYSNTLVQCTGFCLWNKKWNDWYKATFMLWWWKQNNKILEDGKLLAMRGSVCFWKGTTKLPIYFI